MSLKATDFVEVLKGLVGQFFFKWLDKRNPRANHHLLNLRNLYIFPTRKGFLFLFFVMVLWLIGTNYQNNLILALTFLLISVFIVSILHTYANLSSIEVKLKGASNCFAGEPLEFFVDVTNTSRNMRYGVALRWQDSSFDPVTSDLGSNINTSLAVPVATKLRGKLRPPRLLFETEYPLGLLRCWTWLTFDTHALVYPRPVEFPLTNINAIDEGGDGEHPAKGGEDFSGLQAYRPGDSLKRIAWKLYARDRGLHTKEFSQNISREIWLDFAQVSARGTEEKLSALCYWALVFYQQDENFGLLLPTKKILPSKGENHRLEVLEALALFQ